MEMKGRGIATRHHCIAIWPSKHKNVGKPSFPFAFSQQVAKLTLKLLKLMPNQRVKDFKSPL
jgi:hypothetical protein